MSECEALKLFTFNVNSLGVQNKERKYVFDFLRKQSGNIYFLQETHWKSDMENVVRSQCQGFECIVAGQDSGSKGVAVLFKNNFEYKVHNVVKDDEGCYILIDIIIYIEMLNKHI